LRPPQGCEQCDLFGDRRHIPACGRPCIDRLRGAAADVLVALSEVGRRDLDFLGSRLEHAGEFVGRAAKALGEKGPAGIVQTRFGLAAAVIDRQRICVDQHLPHPFRSDGAVAKRAAAGPFRQRGIAVAAGDLTDGADHAA
jgi:hypothetical protein